MARRWGAAFPARPRPAAPGAGENLEPPRPLGGGGRPGSWGGQAGAEAETGKKCGFCTRRCVSWPHVSRPTDAVGIGGH